jgi:predicted metal-dependent enzyme (double-stranded beta helix superfamily)
MPRMKRKHGRLLTAAVGVAMVGTFAAVALGSAGFGNVITLLVPKADLNDAVHLNSDRIKFQTKGPTDVRVQAITFAPGSYSGWHHHPGFVLVAVKSGEVTNVDSQCNATTYGPSSPNGSAFVEYGDEAGEVRNTSSVPATVYVTLVAPDADPPVFRIEDDPPPCA